MSFSSPNDLKDLDFSYSEPDRLAGKYQDDWYHDYRKESLGVDFPSADGRFHGFNEVKKLLVDYKFPNPDLIIGKFEDSGPLLGRNILLLAKFLGFKFTFGVRVVAVVDEQRRIENEVFDCWGYSYRTLQGHFEEGEIRFEIQRNVLTFETYFLIESYSRVGQINNPFYWIGMKLFGRTLQKKFVSDSFNSVQEAFNTPAPIKKP